MLNIRKILLLRVAFPILIPILILGAILYVFVLSTIGEFAQEKIEYDLAFHSRRVYSICNINFDNLLLSGLADDPDELTIKQALTLGQIEDFFMQEKLQGYVFDQQKNKIVFQTYLPAMASTIMAKQSEKQEPVLFEIDQEGYYAYYSEFTPWHWQILVINNADVYEHLITRVQQVHLYTIGSLILMGILMIFFIHRSVNDPTQAIIRNVQAQKRPDYKGIDVFEFLSTTIAGMMTAIRQKEEKYRMLVENSSNMIWEIDLDYRFTFVSPTVTHILGYPPEELIGKEPFIFMNRDDAVFNTQIYKNRFSSKKPIERITTPYLHKNGEIVILETTGRPFYDESLNCIGYRGVNRDITDRVRAENEKIEAQKIAAEQAQQALVGQVAGKMAHDFNNILGIIMGNSELALMDTKEDETRKTLQIVLDQTKRGKNLTKNLVAFAKDQEPKQEFFNINDIINLVLSLMKKDLGTIEVITRYDKKLPELLADPGMIEHSLVNLIQNSIHALSLSTDPTIIISTSLTNTRITVEIRDNGCGIPERHLNDIFTPSFTLKGNKDITGSYQKGIKGTGYGMSNIKKYIQQHKGTVDITSELGNGTAVRIQLPIIKKELTCEEKNDLSNALLFTGKQILVVEDEDTISQVQARVLSDPPFDHLVTVASNAAQAIDLLDSTAFDLVSLDYILPGRLSGVDVYHHIRKTIPTLPILFISGNIEFLESIKDLKKNDPYIDHLSKPCQNTDYVNAVNKLLSVVLN